MTAPVIKPETELIRLLARLYVRHLTEEKSCLPPSTAATPATASGKRA